MPVISAVGHETDFTICDFAADMRAPTPSAAAERATPDKSEIITLLSSQSAHMQKAVQRRVDIMRERLERVSSSNMMKNPMNFIDDRRIYLDTLSEKIVAGAQAGIENKKLSLRGVAAALGALNPLAVLSRGYGAVFSGSGSLIKSTNDIKIGETLKIKVSDGEIDAAVTGKRHKGGKNNG